jgi:hypothetical protein
VTPYGGLLVLVLARSAVLKAPWCSAGLLDVWLVLTLLLPYPAAGAGANSSRMVCTNAINWLAANGARRLVLHCMRAGMAFCWRKPAAG